jgi:hypothetical protein
MFFFWLTVLFFLFKLNFATHEYRYVFPSITDTEEWLVSSYHIIPCVLFVDAIVDASLSDTILIHMSHNKRIKLFNEYSTGSYLFIYFFLTKVNRPNSTS